MKKIIITICFISVFISAFSSSIIQKFVLSDNSVIFAQLVKFEDDYYTIHSKLLGTIKIKSENIISVSKIGNNDLKIDNNKKDNSKSINLNKMPDLSQLGDIQNKIMKNLSPQSIDSLMNSEAIQSIMSNPEIMNAISSGNYTELMNNKEILKLMNDPEIQKLLLQLGR
ncbi:MAG: hypothetical protein M0R46_12945 [Candidatus Muirbacterium halophilum]|nr:hypothetical protein [Candidatus Muirbacterium halophilum]MCK9476826.1 hypothetical protein [Candidatus Muirbacterium halophilum]